MDGECSIWQARCTPPTAMSVEYTTRAMTGQDGLDGVSKWYVDQRKGA